MFLVFPIGWEAAVATGLTAWRPWRDLATAADRLAGRRRGRPSPSPGRPSGFARVHRLQRRAIVGQTPLDTQDAWGGKEFFPPWEVVDAAWRWAIERADPLQAPEPGPPAPVRRRCSSSGLRRLPIAYTLYALPQFLLLATRIQPTPLTSTNRYLLVLFPAFVVLALHPWPRRPAGLGHHLVLFLGLLLAEFQRGTFVRVDAGGVALPR